MKTLLRMIRARRRDDEGMALVLVIGSMMVLTLVASSALAYAVASQPLSRHSQDWNAALSAAQAGVDDYIRHLNENDDYWKTPDCTNTALLGPKILPVGSCSQTASSPVGWQDVYQGDSSAQFHYDVNPNAINSDGTVTVTSTGKVNGVTRTLQVAVGRGGSTDFVYYTDNEQADPSNKFVYPTVPRSVWCSGVDNSGNAVADIHWWQGRSTAGAGCQEIQFFDGDVIDGKVHTNDTPYMGGAAEFKAGLETSDPACKTATSANNDYYGCWRGSKYERPIFDKPPKWAPQLLLPDNTDQFQNDPGCKYSGATRIRFTGDGYMLVWSKNSSTTPACGGVAPWGTKVLVPDGQVIYVQGGGSQHECAPNEIGDGLPATFTQGGKTYVDVNMAEPDQLCGQGNLYIQGTVKGRVTMAASNSIVVTGDLFLAGGLSGSDMVGLVANNSVEVYHPVSATQTCKYNRWTRTTECSWSSTHYDIPGWPQTAQGQGSNGGIQIYASIQTLRHSFYVQQYSYGQDQGTLSVYGSIAQRWRGIVGQSGGYGGMTGYLKSYQYDARLKFSAPPYFPQWTNAVWSARHTGEVTPLYGNS